MRLLKPLIVLYLEICDPFLSRLNGFWELFLRPLGKYDFFNMAPTFFLFL